MDQNKIRQGLSEFEQYHVERYIKYCLKMLTETKGYNSTELKNPWMEHRDDYQLIDFFINVARDGVFIDGEDITLISTGVSYSYQAYKKLMLMAYPETVIDVQLVYKDDKFSFRKESGRVFYKHEINNPFDEKKDENVIGGYCIIKNNRGEFFTALSAAEIANHRKVAKTDSIWRSWFQEMCLKTVIKKGCKRHFKDAFSNVETIDNENYDLEKPLGISVETKQEIESFDDVSALRQYCKDNIGKNAGVKEDFVKACTQRADEIEKGQNEN